MAESSSRKILSTSELERWRMGRERVVFTNGVFDLLHRGHVALLEQARSLGDCLIVALNDDESARRLEKGSDRPLNTLADRQAVVAALASVDCVISFHEDTPGTLIERLSPDILVKGGDYRGRTIPGRAHVESTGGRVVTIDYLAGSSTTEILRRIRGTK